MSKTPQTRIIGIDFGVARIGLAYSDVTKMIAMPLPTLKTERKTEATLQKLLQTLQQHQKDQGYTVETIVVGLPLLLSGKRGFLADEVEHFVSAFRPLIAPIPVITWDERMTSVQAERALKEGSMRRKERAQHVDAAAAVLILQSYLDKLKLESNQF